MFSVTVYIENENGIVKLTESFDTVSQRNDWLMDKLINTDFSYLIVNGEPVQVGSVN